MAQSQNLRPRQQDAQYPAFSRILMSGKAFVADVSGALYWPAEDVLVVSDLRLAKVDGEGEWLGAHTPSNDLRAALAKLRGVIQKFDASRLLILGDSLPNSATARGYSSAELKQLREISNEIDVCWIADQVDEDIAAVIDSAILPNVTIGGLTFRQKPISAAVCYEVAGGASPEARVSVRGQITRSKCFVSNGSRLIMPAFVDGGEGVNVLDRRFDSILHSDSVFVWTLGWSDVHQVAARQLLED